MGDHTECFQVDFDPAAVAYEELLDRFWQSHDATRPAFKTQYASLVLAHDEEQVAVAQESARAYAQLFGRPVTTRIEMLDRFYLAEDYHQKYYLQNDRTLAQDFRAIYRGAAELRESSAAMRANSYLYGAGTCARLDRELPLLGVSDASAARLRANCR